MRRSALANPAAYSVSRAFFSAFGDVACRSVDQAVFDIEKCAPSKPAVRSVAATKAVFQVSDGDALCEPVDLRERDDPIFGLHETEKGRAVKRIHRKAQGGLERRVDALKGAVLVGHA